MRRRDQVPAAKPQATSKKRPGGPALRPPSLKRAAIQGAILAALYFVLIRFIWKQEDGSVVTYVHLPRGRGFIAYTAIAYAIDRFKYQTATAQAEGSAK